MPTSAKHHIPTPSPTDVATVPTHMKAMADKVDSELDSIAPGQITGVGAGKMLIANSSGVLTPQTIHGEATLGDDGTLTIGDGQVSTPELVLSAVTTDKIASGAVTRSKFADGTVGLSNLKMKGGTITISSIANGGITIGSFTHNLGHTNYVAMVCPGGSFLSTLEVSWQKGSTLPVGGDYRKGKVISVNVRNLTGSFVYSVEVSVLVIDLT